MGAKSRKHYRTLHGFIYLSSAIFIAILQLTGWMEPSIRMLHMWQTAIYIAVIILCSQRKVVGYGAGMGIAAFWNAGNLFVTTFIKSGWTVLLHLLRTGTDQHPELVVAPIAAGAHFVLIGACISAYLLREKRRRFDLAVLLGGAFGAVLAFYFMVRTWGPQYLHIFWSMLGWLGIPAKH